MTSFLLALACLALGITVYFLRLMADGRRLYEKMIERQPRFVARSLYSTTPESPGLG